MAGGHGPGTSSLRSISPPRTLILGSGPTEFARLKNRLKKLAENLDALAAKDEELLRHAREIAEVRARAAVELYSICAGFVAEVNRLVAHTELKLDPPDYTSRSYRDIGPNLIQINARGRILQIEFEATEQLVSTEEFRVPYTLAGSVRCFNQEWLERDSVNEQLLFYCLEKARNLWLYFDARTYRTGSFDQEYLITLMEQLV
jgi:hypothetical protein